MPARCRYKDEVHDGEHAAIIDPDTWQRVQTILAATAAPGGPVRNQFGALLKGILRCEDVKSKTAFAVPSAPALDSKERFERHVTPHPGSFGAFASRI